MAVNLYTYAEKQANQATELATFNGIALRNIKEGVDSILKQIGKHGIFEEYTKHDIGHVNRMLESYDFIIPQGTKEKPSPADWLMIVLATYFHDVGMLVTKKEYKTRNNELFNGYRKQALQNEDFRQKIESLEVEEQDRFLYQEFVRKNHGIRIRHWIMGELVPGLEGSDAQACDVVKELLSKVNKGFRVDLANICESHSLSDLENFEKYNVSRPYGPTSKETVNVFYAALMLRTADLMHITCDRTPTIELRLINPTDPISQQEWAKQNAIQNVRAQIRKRDGVADPSLIPDTFEVTASFDHELGYFALISYLNYARKELTNCYEINKEAKNRHASIFDFPWRHIDDSAVDANGFEKKQFGFELDQNKILDLLVGHTLYNDSTVVLRELAQNSIDATRLKKYELEKNSCGCGYDPGIDVRWDEVTRELFIEDNGTGMDLDMIENHLLKVGSSRYQDERFKKDYPDFSSISRFGIGLLTCFLIADDIDILTKTEEIPQTILLKIRKVYGKYLLKYGSDDASHRLPNPKYGTSIRLYVRNGIDLSEIEDDLRKWILFPGCRFTLHRADKQYPIGCRDPKEMLTQLMEQQGYSVDGIKYKVDQYEEEGVTVAFALRYYEYWKEWVLMASESEYNTYGRSRNSLLKKRHTVHSGNAIEGIRIDFDTPGYQNSKFYVVANYTGKNAPKTNVARSNIELTSERESMLENIYGLYGRYLSNQSEALEREFSLSWAVSETNFLLRSISSDDNSTRLLSPELFEKTIYGLDCILIENDEGRRATNVNQLIGLQHFWTVECKAYRSADRLIKEVKKSNSSALSIFKSIYGENETHTQHLDQVLPNFVGLCWAVKKILFKEFQITELKAVKDQRRLDLKWSLTNSVYWSKFPVTTRSNNFEIYIQQKEVSVTGLKDETAINTDLGLLILRASPAHDFLIRMKHVLLEGDSAEKRTVFNLLLILVHDSYHGYLQKKDSFELEKRINGTLNQDYNRIIRDIFWETIDKDELFELLLNESFVKYDNSVWYRNDGEE